MSLRIPPASRNLDTALSTSFFHQWGAKRKDRTALCTVLEVLLMEIFPSDLNLKLTIFRSPQDPHAINIADRTTS
jgi:hypothetical protein